MRFFVTSMLLAVLLGLAPHSSCNAQQWSRFRGPNGGGVAEAKALPITWKESDYLWRVGLPGQGHSSPVVWDNKLFLLSAVPGTATRYVLCHSTEDGRQLWKREYPSATHHLHARNTFASTTPAVDKDRVYVTWSTPDKVTLLALDHDGRDVWELDLGPWTSQHGFGTSPMLFDDMVILSNNQQADQLEEGQKPGKSFILAVDAATGKQRWRTRRTSIRVCYSTPCIYQPDGQVPQLICTSTAEGVYSLDPFTGKENWQVPECFRMRVVSSPLVTDNMIFGSTGSGGGGNYVVAVRPGERPEIAYTVKTSAPYVPCAVAAGDLVFLFGDKGVVSCIELESGAEHWRERVSRAGFSGSPVLADGRIYCIDDDGFVFVIAASPRFDLLGENSLGEPTRSTPAIVGNRIYLRTMSHLMCVRGG